MRQAEPSASDRLDREVPVPADAELVERARGGDAVAFELIMRRYNQRLYRLARGIVKNGSEAEDVVQESYLRAYEGLAGFVGPQGFTAWIGKIVINESLGRLRKSGRVISLEDHLDNSNIGGNRTWADAMKSDDPGPERLAASSELRRLLERAISALPQEFRTVFILRAIEGMSVLETAQTLSIRPETVKTRFHRARHLLRHTLGSQFNALMPSIFSLGGRRCDSIVVNVFSRLHIKAS